MLTPPSSQVREARWKQNGFVPPAGAYLENCKYVDHDYIGNSGVMKLDALILKAAQRPVKPTASADLIQHRCEARIRICMYAVLNITVPLLLNMFNVILRAAQRPGTSTASGNLLQHRVDAGLQIRSEPGPGEDVCAKRTSRTSSK